jgi:hypothetical protein
MRIHVTYTRALYNTLYLSPEYTKANKATKNLPSTLDMSNYGNTNLARMGSIKNSVMEGATFCPGTG